jgi:Domain of unknown function (DUF6398)
VICVGELKFPRALRPVVEELVGITDAVCLAVLDEEYADLARRAVAKLARKRPSPLTGGRRATWSAGIVYALGQVNFLSDPASEPCVTADELSEAFGVAKSTMGSKARQVRDLLRISPFSPEFQRADVAAQNPLIWFIEVNGLAVDARHVPLEIQIEAFERRLIPYVPALGPDGTAACAEPRRVGPAGGAAPAETAHLLEHCSELKRQLVEFASSRRFSRQLGRAVREALAAQLLMRANSPTCWTVSSCSSRWQTAVWWSRCSPRSILSWLTMTASCCWAGGRWWRASSRSASGQGARSSPPVWVTRQVTVSAPTPGQGRWRRCGQGAS